MNVHATASSKVSQSGRIWLIQEFHGGECTIVARLLMWPTFFPPSHPFSPLGAGQQLLSPTVILPLGILVPIVATRIWHSAPLRQFMTAYRFRVTLVPLLDVLMLLALRQRHHQPHTTAAAQGLFWCLIVAATAAQAIVNSMQFNAQMTFFARRVDPAIGGSYMTLLNTAANLGGTWPASFVMWLVGTLSKGREADCDGCPPQHDPYFAIQGILSLLGCLWIVTMGRTVHQLEMLPDDAWRTHVEEEDSGGDKKQRQYQQQQRTKLLLSSVDVQVDDASIVYTR
jgi:Acetyl-coenzyme A transporter 1